MATVIFVHGFGVMKDARGMFTDIAKELAEHGIKPILFDLNRKDDVGNIMLSPFSLQVEKLKAVFNENQSDDISLIAHSQGCVIAALADLPNIRKTIFLAPPTDNNPERTIAYFKQNPLTHIDTNGISQLARRDDTFTIVPKIYWDERIQVDMTATYKKYLSSHKTVVVKAEADEVVSNELFESLFANTNIIRIDTGHDFPPPARQELVKYCLNLIEGEKE